MEGLNSSLRGKIEPCVSAAPTRRAEAEITKLVELASDIAERTNLPAAGKEELLEMKQMVQPEAVLDAIEESEETRV